MIASGTSVGWNTGVTNTGAFYKVDGIGDDGNASATGVGGVGFNASRCSSVYGASTTVQPPAITMRFYIKY